MNIFGKRENDDIDNGIINNLSHELKKVKIVEPKSEGFITTAIHDQSESIANNLSYHSQLDLNGITHIFNTSNFQELEQSRADLEDILKELTEQEDFPIPLPEEENNSHIIQENELNLHLPEAHIHRLRNQYNPQQTLTFVELFQDKKKAHEHEPEAPHDEKLIQQVIKELNPNINFHTAKTWVQNSKRPEWLLTLQDEVKNHAKTKHVGKNIRRLAYDPNLELQICDFVEFFREKEVGLTPEDVKDFAKALIRPKCKSFVGGNKWFGNFLRRNDLVLKKPSGKSVQKLPFGWEILKSQFISAVNNVVKSNDIRPEFILTFNLFNGRKVNFQIIFILEN